MRIFAVERQAIFNRWTTTPCTYEDPECVSNVQELIDWLEETRLELNSMNIFQPQFERDPAFPGPPGNAAISACAVDGGVAFLGGNMRRVGFEFFPGWDSRACRLEAHFDDVVINSGFGCQPQTPSIWSCSLIGRTNQLTLDVPALAFGDPGVRGANRAAARTVFVDFEEAVHHIRNICGDPFDPEGVIGRGAPAGCCVMTPE